MASIFKPPKITQEQLSSTLLEYGEIVYNTSKKEFFTGNGTSGGISLFNEKPTKTSELTNDNGFVTSTYVDDKIAEISDFKDILIVESENLTIGGVNEDNTPKFTNVDINSKGLIVHNNTHNLLSVLDDELKYKNDYDIQRMKRKTANTFTFESNTFLSLTENITSINFSLPQGTLENAILQFTTGDNIEFTITGSSSYKINKPFAFEPNETYIIYVDIYDILWCKLYNINQ